MVVKQLISCDDLYPFGQDLMATKILPVRECSASSPGELDLIREPAVVRGVDLGEAPALWRDASYLANRCPQKQVRVHASSTPHMDFITKNFSYK